MNQTNPGWELAVVGKQTGSENLLAQAEQKKDCDSIDPARVLAAVERTDFVAAAQRGWAVAEQQTDSAAEAVVVVVVVVVGVAARTSSAVEAGVVAEQQRGFAAAAEERRDSVEAAAAAEEAAKECRRRARAVGPSWALACASRSLRCWEDWAECWSEAHS